MPEVSKFTQLYEDFKDFFSTKLQLQLLFQYSLLLPL